MKKIISVSFVLLFAVGTFLAGCSPAKPSAGGTPSTKTSEGNSAPPSKEKVIVDLWWPLSKNNVSDENTFKALELYNSKNPNVEVRPQSIPYDQLSQKIITATNAGTAPDVTVGLAEWVPQFSQMNILTDLTPEISKWAEKDGIPKTIWDTVDMNGKMVGIPQYIGIRALQVHEEMLKKAGVTQVPKTWDELIDVGKKIKEKGMIPFGISGKSVRSPQEFIVYFWQNETDIAAKMPDGKFKNIWNDNPEEMKKAAGVFEFYKKMLDQGIISKDEVNWGYREMDTNFAQGRVAMVVDGSWMKNYEKENPATMADVKISAPIYSKKPATFLEVNSMLTYKASKHHKEAVDFMLWWSGKEAQSIVYSARSVRTDVSEPGKWGEEFSKLISQGKSWPPVALGGITQSMIDSLQYLLLGQKSPEEAAKWLSEQVNKTLKENNQLSVN